MQRPIKHHPSLFSSQPDESSSSISTLKQLRTDCLALIAKAQFEDAIAKAELGCQHLGIKGYLHYFEVNLRCIPVMKSQNEIVDQDVIKMLSLILFLKKHHKTDPRSLSQLEIIEKKFTTMIPELNDLVLHEIHTRALTYASMNPEGSLDRVKAY